MYGRGERGSRQDWLSDALQDPETLSGTPVQRYFCQTCGVPIMSITPLFEGKVILKLGM